MRTIELKIYSFSELSEEAQQKAISKQCGINVINVEWWDNLYEDAKEIGLKITSFDLDRNRHAKGEFILSANEVAENIIKNHGDIFGSTYKTAQNFIEEWNPLFHAYETGGENTDLEGDINDLKACFLNSLLEDYSILLQNEYEYLQTDEAIKDTIEANEYEFTEEGEIYN